MKLEKKRIIYIEDDHRNRKLVELILTAEGAQVWFEHLGFPSLSVATVMRYRPVDLILLDLMFADDYSGYDVFAELRKWSQLDDVPIVMVSAADAAVEMQRARQTGLSSYIAKPIDSDLFATQLASILVGQPVWQAGVRH